MSSTARERISYRSMPVMASIWVLPCSAARADKAASSMDARGTVSKGIPVNGFTTSIFSSLSTHCPAMYIFMLLFPSLYCGVLRFGV